MCLISHLNLQHPAVHIIRWAVTVTKSKQESAATLNSSCQTWGNPGDSSKESLYTGITHLYFLYYRFNSGPPFGVVLSHDLCLCTARFLYSHVLLGCFHPFPTHWNDPAAREDHAVHWALCKHTLDWPSHSTVYCVAEKKHRGWQCNYKPKRQVQNMVIDWQKTAAAALVKAEGSLF